MTSKPKCSPAYAREAPASRTIVGFDDPAWSSNRFDVASDGRRCYFTVEDRRSDVWVAEVARR